MERIASYCLTEPGSGSDAAALRTRAVRDGDDYVLNGTKPFISGAGVSDLYLVMVRTGGDGAARHLRLLIEKDTPGLSFGANETQDGLERAADRARSSSRMPRAGRRTCSARRARASAIAMAGLDGGRLNIAACSLGGAQAALDGARLHARAPGLRRSRSPTSRPCSSASPTWRPNCRRRASSCCQAAWQARRRRAGRDQASAPWPSASSPTPASASPNDALQLHGGYGYLADYGIEKIVRDLRVHQILEGTNEIMRVIVARALLAGPSG